MENADLGILCRLLLDVRQIRGQFGEYLLAGQAFELLAKAAEALDLLLEHQTVENA